MTCNVKVGDREDSNVYIRMKIKSAEAIGAKAIHLRLANTTTEQEVGRLCFMSKKYFLFSNLLLTSEIPQSNIAM